MDMQYQSWFDGKTLSTDWTSRDFETWDAQLASLRAEPLHILEIGSWEGRSALFFMNYFRNSFLTCIDTFQGSAEHRAREHWAAQLGSIEERFDSNTREFRERIEKIKRQSFYALAGLALSRRTFDLAFIDGSHHSADVLSDAMLTWPMVKEGGIVIFDDYEWTYEAPEAEKPKLGIDAFLRTRPSAYRELLRGYQLMIQKTASSP